MRADRKRGMRDSRNTIKCKSTAVCRRGGLCRCWCRCWGRCRGALRCRVHRYRGGGCRCSGCDSAGWCHCRWQRRRIRAWCGSRSYFGSCPARSCRCGCRCGRRCGRRCGTRCGRRCRDRFPRLHISLRPGSKAKSNARHQVQHEHGNRNHGQCIARAGTKGRVARARARAKRTREAAALGLLNKNGQNQQQARRDEQDHEQAGEGLAIFKGKSESYHGIRHR